MERRSARGQGLGRRLGEEAIADCQQATRGITYGGNVLCPDCQRLGSMVVVLYYIFFLRSDLLEEIGVKVTWPLSVLLLKAAT